MTFVRRIPMLGASDSSKFDFPLLKSSVCDCLFILVHVVSWQRILERRGNTMTNGREKRRMPAGIGDNLQLPWTWINAVYLKIVQSRVKERQRMMPFWFSLRWSSKWRWQDILWRRLFKPSMPCFIIFTLLKREELVSQQTFSSSYSFCVNGEREKCYFDVIAEWKKQLISYSLRHKSLKLVDVYLFDCLISISARNFLFSSLARIEEAVVTRKKR